MPGYRILDIDKEGIPEKYMCSFCGLLLRDAKQTSCGHFYCETCVTTLAVDDILTCLLDGEQSPIDMVYPDNFVRREIFALVVRCINAEAGCKWRGEVRHLTSHSSECEYQNVQCTNVGCDVVVVRRSLQDHLKNDCKYRNIPCPYCEIEIPMADMENHQLDECMKYPTKCSKCHAEGISRDRMRTHLDQYLGDCPEIEGPCPFAVHGCLAKEVMNKERRSKHMKNSTAAHLSLLQKDYLELKQQLATKDTSRAKSLLSPNEGLKDDVINDLTINVEAVMKENADIKRQIEEQSKILLEIQRSTSSASEIVHELPTASNAPMLKDTDSSEAMKDLRKRITNIENRLAQQKRSTPSTKLYVDDMETLDDVKRNLEELSIIQQAMDTRLLQQETSLSVNTVTMAEFGQSLSDLNLVTYDGTLVWKITDFARRRTEALSGRETSFYSHPFYSKRQGYKMCARIYPNGDGMGRGNSISLFFVIMRGEHDALLRWPFRQKVTMMLLDQDNVEHIIDAFRPDPTSSSFQRPRAKMNIASGCPLFCPLSELQKHAYIKEDTMFIKIIVDAMGT